MSASIGKASLVLNATYGRLTSGLDTAYGKVMGWRGKIAGFAGGGFAGAVGGRFLGDALNTIKELADVGKRAKAIGAGSAEFMALGQAAEKAGVKAEEFQGLLGKLQGKLGTAAFGGEAVATLKQLGLNYDDLKGRRIDQQFLMISDAIAKVKDPNAAAALSMKLFEEQGTKLMPMLRQGSAELNAFITKQKKLGAALSDQDMGKILAARNALPKVEAVFTGAWNRIVVGIAPLVESLATRLSNGFERAAPFLDALVGGAETFFAVFDAAMNEVGAVVDELLASAEEWVGFSFSGADAWSIVQDVVLGAIRGVARGVMYVEQFGKSIAAVGAQVIAMILEPIEKVKKEIAELVRWAGKLSLGGMLFPDLYEAVADGVENTNFAGLAQSLDDWSGRMWNGWDELDGRFERFDGWLDRAARKKDDLGKPTRIDLEPNLTGKGDFLGGALLRGSAAEVSARVKFDAGGLNDVQRQQLAEVKSGNAIAARTAAATEKIAANLSPLGAF